MRIGAVVPCRAEFRFLPAVVGQLLKHADRVLVVRSTRPLSGADAGALPPIPRLDRRAGILEGEWLLGHDARNAGVAALAEDGCEYCFAVDSDEILLDADLAKLRSFCGRKKHKAIGTRLLTYWKTPEWRIDPPEILVAPMVVRKDARFVDDRRVSDGIMEWAPGIWCRHLSYVRTDAEIQEKLRTFAHAHEIVPGWYDRVWKGWDKDNGMIDLHPTHPQNYARAVHDPDPALAAILAEFGCA